MEVFKTNNISKDDLKSDIAFKSSNDLACPKWLYRGSLLSHLEYIPDDLSFLVPYGHYVKYGFKNIQRSGTKLFDLKFSIEGASVVTNNISEKLETVDLDSAFDDLKYYILLVSTELVRNGIIQNLKRDEKQQVNLLVEESAQDIFITVNDPYGSLICKDFTSRLKRVAEFKNYERKQYGAGLGLFMVINSVNTIQIDVNKNESTKITCSINKYKRLKHFKEKETAIFFNLKEEL